MYIERVCVWDELVFYLVLQFPVGTFRSLKLVYVFCIYEGFVHGIKRHLDSIHPVFYLDNEAKIQFNTLCLHTLNYKMPLNAANRCIVLNTLL